MIPEIDGTHGIDFRDYDYIKDLLVVELERSEFNGEHLSHGILKSSLLGHWFCTLGWNRRTSWLWQDWEGMYWKFVA